MNYFKVNLSKLEMIVKTINITISNVNENESNVIFSHVGNWGAERCHFFLWQSLPGNRRNMCNVNTRK